MKHIIKKTINVMIELIVEGLDYEFEHYIKGNEISTVR